MADGGFTNAGAEAILHELMPVLPHAEDMELDENSERPSFEDSVLLVLAALVTEGGILTYREYKLALDALGSVFGEAAADSEMQARFHYALLHPTRQAEAVAGRLAEAALEESVAAERIESFLAALDDLCGKTRYPAENGRRLHEIVRLTFAEKNIEERRSLLEGTAMGRGFEKGMKAGRSAVTSSVGAVQSALSGIGDRLPSVFSSSKGDKPAHSFKMPVRVFNEGLRADAGTLAASARALGLAELAGHIDEFSGILTDQTFRVVVMGEGKRGKSSLVNAILGEALSPVQESLPETAVSAEFFYSRGPVYKVRFLGDEEFAEVRKYLAGNGDNVFLREKLEKLGGERLKGERSLGSRAEIYEYLSVGGRYSSFASSLSIGLPIPALREGMVLVDSPGLNSTDEIQNWLARRECLSADCIVFVMDARKPDSATELSVLTDVIRKGRSVSVIGVITGTDRLNSPGSTDAVRNRAGMLLEEGSRLCTAEAAGQGAEAGAAPAGRIDILGVVCVNAREAMERITAGKEYHGQDWDAFLGLIAQAVRSDRNKDAYRERMRARAAGLLAEAEAGFMSAAERYKASLPDKSVLEMLARHNEDMARSAQGFAEQAEAAAEAAARDIAEWCRIQEKALDDMEAAFTDRIMLAAHEHAGSLGNRFARPSLWKEFDEGKARAIASEVLDAFVAEQDGQLRAWEEKLHLFRKELHEISVSCLQTVADSAVVTGSICATGSRGEDLLVQSNVHLKRLALFLTGAGTGVLAAGSLFNIAVIGSTALMAITHPVALPVAVLAGAAAWMWGRKTDPEKRKAVFLEKKKKQTAEWAHDVRMKLETELDGRREEITSLYRIAVLQGFVPSLRLLVGECAHLHWYLEVMGKMEADAGRITDDLLGGLTDMRRAAGQLESGK
ncbi:MAG: dynamin family protein [Mailhella sp.]|nr:dynamin family protein [Mailhella sp.]